MESREKSSDTKILSKLADEKAESTSEQHEIFEYATDTLRNSVSQQYTITATSQKDLPNHGKAIASLCGSIYVYYYNKENKVIDWFELEASPEFYRDNPYYKPTSQKDCVLAVHPNGNLITTRACYAKTIVFLVEWDLKTRKEKARTAINLLEQDVREIEVLKNGKIIILTSKKMLLEIPSISGNHPHKVYSLRETFRERNVIAISLNSDGTLHTWIGSDTYKRPTVLRGYDDSDSEDELEELLSGQSAPLKASMDLNILPDLPPQKDELNGEEKVITKDVEQKPLQGLHVVLDIDNTISTGAVASDDSEIQKYLETFRKNGIATDNILQLLVEPTVTALQVLHAGSVEFAKWLHHVLGARISFFSSGIEARNKLFVQEYLSHALGKEEYTCIKHRVLIKSRGDMKAITEIQRNAQKSFGIRSGNLKKDLEVTLKDTENLTLTVFVDDDPCYIYPGQEKNSLIANSTYSTGCFHFKETGGLDELLRLNNIFYIVGILKCALDMTQKGEDFLNNLFKLQFESKDIFTYEPISSLSRNRLQYYHDGLKELQKINPHLEFCGASRLKKLLDRDDKRTPSIAASLNCR
ncbi:MAG: hypothetical protein ABI370_06540 [Gammaproteobacteria bacterium]